MSVIYMCMVVLIREFIFLYLWLAFPNRPNGIMMLTIGELALTILSPKVHHMNMNMKSAVMEGYLQCSAGSPAQTVYNMRGKSLALYTAQVD